MARLRQWQVIVNKVLEKIRNNDLLLRLACNEDNNPYEKEAPKWPDILMKNVFPMPKEPYSVSEQKSFINVYISETVPYENNPYYHEDYLFVEVGCHIETWLLDNGEIRPYTMCAMIDEMLDNFSINDMSVNKVVPEQYKVLKFGDMFYGYRMTYKLSNIGAMNCG